MKKSNIKIYLFIIISMVMFLQIKDDVYAKTESDVKNWLDSQNGKAIDYDGAYGVQCVDFFNYYLKNFWGYSNPISMYPVSYAYQIFNYNQPSGWQKISGNSSFRTGDIVVWSNAIGHGCGHVGVIYSSDSSGVKVAHENWGAKYVTIISLPSTNNIRGVFRPALDEETCSCSTSYAGKYIINTSRAPLSMRSGHGTNYSIITTIPKGTEVEVTKANGSWAHVKWNGYSGYCAMEYLKKKETDRQIKLHVWVSDDKMGAVPSKYYTGNRYYLCYELIYNDTNEKIGNAKNYTVTEQFTLPNGKTSTYTYNNDNNWYSIVCTTEGNYKGAVTVSGDIVGTTNVNFDVKVKDDEKPVIKNVRVSNVSSTGYTVSCEVTDNIGVDRVQFPTWTEKNGQDDIQSNWGSSSAARGTKLGNTYTYRVNISDHNYERGKYSTHIYAYDKSGNFAADGSVTVNVPKPDIHVSSVELTDENSNDFIAVYMCQGETMKLKVNVKPQSANNKNVRWTSDDSSVAMVDSTGKITAKNFGTTRITVTTEDGNYSDSCLIKVGTMVHYGDVDNDRKITVSDYSELENILDGTVNPPNEDDEERCNLDGNYAIDDDDLKVLGQFVNGKIDVFPAETMIYKVSIIKYPDKRDYIVGEKFDSTGIRTAVVYGNGKTKEISACSFNYDFSKTGQRRVYMIYSENGRKCIGFFFVNVSKKETKRYIVKFTDANKIVNTQFILEGNSAIAPKLSKKGYTLYWDDKFDKVYENMTIKAKWVANDYRVNFNVAEGKVGKKSMKVTYGDEYGELPEPERSGYLFDGWYTKKTGGDEVSEFTVMNTAKNHTLYAHWKKVTVSKISIKKLTALRKSMKITMKTGKGGDGYQIMYSIKKNFRSNKKINTSNVVKKITKLKNHTKYYVKVRGYVYDSKDKKVYGAWSKVYTIVVK